MNNELYEMLKWLAMGKRACYNNNILNFFLILKWNGAAHNMDLTERRAFQKRLFSVRLRVVQLFIFRPNDRETYSRFYE